MSDVEHHRPRVADMTREERRVWLAATQPRHDLAKLIRGHRFESSRPWPDGSKPEAPNWNPGCSCGEGMYFFEHDLHLADVLIAAGYTRATAPGPSAADYDLAYRLNEFYGTAIGHAAIPPTDGGTHE